jgi:LysR family transcriptional regulator, nitrogen assimilation regulatory protein
MTYAMEEMCRLIRSLIAEQVGRGAWEATLLI